MPVSPEQLVRILARLIKSNRLREGQGEDTVGVLMKCGAFQELVALANAIDACDPE